MFLHLGFFPGITPTRIRTMTEHGPIPGRPSDFTRECVIAALSNRDIRQYLGDAHLRYVWTEGGVRRHPMVRVEFEHVHVIGGLGESLAAARHKHFGRVLGVHPLRPDDPVHPSRILFVYQESSPFDRRVEQRKALKRLLGRQHSSLVTKAAPSTKRDFLKYDLTPDGACAIRCRLGLDPGRFWRAAKGREFLDIPAPHRQLLLFPE
jgi:hypothetical protein